MNGMAKNNRVGWGLNLWHSHDIAWLAPVNIDGGISLDLLFVKPTGLLLV